MFKFNLQPSWGCQGEFRIWVFLNRLEGAALVLQICIVT